MKPEEVRDGDILFFDNGDSYTNICIAKGNGDSARPFIDVWYRCEKYTKNEIIKASADAKYCVRIGNVNDVRER